MQWPSPHLPEQGAPAFEGSRIRVQKTNILGRSQNYVSREVVVHPGSVVILPLLDPDTLVLIRNERFAVGETLWELPAGTLEPGEEPDHTARRELEEESGYACGTIERLLAFYPSPGFLNEVMYAYVAKELSWVGQHLDDNEKIEVYTKTWPEALAMIEAGQILDGKTLSTLLYYQQYCR